MLALRHVFGFKDDKGTIDVGIRALGDIFVDKLTRRDVEAWRDSWEPRVNASAYAPTMVNEWIAVLRVITKKMRADFALPVDPCADVEDISAKMHDYELPPPVRPRACRRLRAADSPQIAPLRRRYDMPAYGVRARRGERV